MSPIDFPDLLEERGDAGRGRRKSSHGRLISQTLRSRSRSRSTARAQRRSASCQPNERKSTAEEVIAEKKKRRSQSRPADSRQPKEQVKAALKKSSSKKAEVEISAKERSKSKDRSKKVRTPSPSKRRSTIKTSNQSANKKKDWSADIINLVDRDEDEFLLNEIMSGKNPVINPTGKKPKSERKMVSKSDKVNSRTSKLRKMASTSNLKTSTRDNSSPSKKEKYAATHGGGSPKSVVRFPNKNPADVYSDDELSDSEDESEDEDTNSVATNDLLDQVKSRMEQQRLLEEAKDLRKVIEKKDAEIEQLTGQLRMAISTKCDLVIAHTELERLHETDLKHRDQYAEDMKRANLALMEVRAEVEKEFMNELNDLSKQVQEAEGRRVNETEDKDETIRLLEDKVRRLELTAMGGQSARRDSDKVKYYKKKLGVYDQ